MDDAKRIVERGYDAIAERYSEWHSRNTWPVGRFARELDVRLAEGSNVLELGCGEGIPATKLLAARHRVTGVDISARQLERARANVPEARFVHADMASLELPEESFDGVAIFLSMTHVPRTEHAGLLALIFRWLRPGGWLVCSMGNGDNPDWFEPDWLGSPSFFSHFDADTNLRLVREAGFEVEWGEPVAMMEDDREVAFLWLIARKP